MFFLKDTYILIGTKGLTAIISKLKKRNRLIKTVNLTEGGWVVVAEYEEEHFGSNSDDCKRIRQETKNKSTGKEKHRKIEIKCFEAHIYPPESTNRETVLE